MSTEPEREPTIEEYIRDAVNGVAERQYDPAGVTDWLISLVEGTDTTSEAESDG